MLAKASKRGGFISNQSLRGGRGLAGRVGHWGGASAAGHGPLHTRPSWTTPLLEGSRTEQGPHGGPHRRGQLSAGARPVAAVRPCAGLFRSRCSPSKHPTSWAQYA